MTSLMCTAVNVRYLLQRSGKMLVLLLRWF